MEAGLLRRHSLGEGTGRESIHLLTGDAVFFCEVFGGLDHRDAGRRVVQRFPQKILEFHRCTQLEAGAVGEGGDRVARHGLGAREQRHVGAAALDLLAGLAEQLETRAADALGHQRRHGLGHAGVQADVARQHELLVVAGRHVAGDHGADVLARHAGARQHRAGRLDTQIGGGDVAQ
jgi:hypothetical protein